MAEYPVDSTERAVDNCPTLQDFQDQLFKDFCGSYSTTSPRSPKPREDLKFNQEIFDRFSDFSWCNNCTAHQNIDPHWTTLFCCRKLRKEDGFEPCSKYALVKTKCDSRGPGTTDWDTLHPQTQQLHVSLRPKQKATRKEAVIPPQSLIDQGLADHLEQQLRIQGKKAVISSQDLRDQGLADHIEQQLRIQDRYSVLHRNRLFDFLVSLKDAPPHLWLRTERSEEQPQSGIDRGFAALSQQDRLLRAATDLQTSSSRPTESPEELVANAHEDTESAEATPVHWNI
jgi:hypothetical protein